MANLYGRERDLSRVGLALSRALEGDGALVLVTGEAGIGKSAFGKEVGARASAAGMRVLAGRCWESGGAAPYWPWVQVFRSLGTTPFEGLARADGGDAQQRRFQSEAMEIRHGVPTLFIAAEASVLLQDRQAAAVIADQLERRSWGARFFWGGVGAYAFGPTSRALGELAHLLGRPTEARRHFEDSIALCRHIGAQPFLALSMAGLERVNAAERGVPMNAPAIPSPPQAPPTYPASAGPPGADAPVTAPRSQPRAITLRREGDVWAMGGSA